MNVLCADPALTKSGLAVISTEFGILHVQNIVQTSDKSQGRRIYEAYEILCEVVQKYDVEFVVTEGQFVQAMSLAAAVPELVAGRYNLPLLKYMPKSWKLLATGSGSIPENELFEKVYNRFNLETLSLEGQLTEHIIDCLGLYMAFEVKKQKKLIWSDNSTVVLAPKEKKKRNGTKVSSDKVTSTIGRRKPTKVTARS